MRSVREACAGEEERVLALGAVRVDASLDEGAVEVDVGEAEIDVLQAVPFDARARNVVCMAADAEALKWQDPPK